MNLIMWIIFGALAGWIASMIAGTNERQGALGNIAYGILGALLGGFIMSLLGGNGINEFSIYSLLVAIGGALLLTWITKKMA